MRRYVLQLAIAGFALVSVFLSACGSGGGGGDTPLPPVPVAPSITSQPASASVTAGQTVSFSVTAAGTSPQYQWRKNGTAIAGATLATLSFTAVEGDDNAQYTVEVSNQVSSVISTAAALRVTPAAVSITSQPASASVAAGQTVNFTVTAAGTSPQYQWRKNGTAIAGATQATLSFTAAEGDDNAQYTVVVSNSVSTATSTAATLRVNLPVVITTQPTELGVVAGQTASFTVTATGSNLQYQWLRNGSDIAGANAATYSFLSSLGDDGAAYSVRVSNPVGSATSNTVSLRVTAQFVPVSVTSQPQNATARAGEEVTFSVVLGGTGPFSWVWLRNGVSTGVGVSNTYVNTPSLTFAPALLSQNGTVISLRITDSAGNTVDTQGVTLTVSP